MPPPPLPPYVRVDYSRVKDMALLLAITSETGALILLEIICMA